MLIGTLIFFISAHSKTLAYIVDKATVGLGLSYESISGSLLQEIELKNLKYQNKILADEARVKWNILYLLKAKVAIEDIVLKDVNLNVLDEMISNISKDRSKDKEQKSSSITIPYISINNLFFSTKPYHARGIKIEKFEIKIKNLRGDLNNLELDNFQIDTINDHTNIMANGYIRDKELKFEHLWVQDIDIDKIINFNIKQFSKNDENLTDTSQKSEDDTFSNLLQTLYVKDFKADIKPFKYDQYHIKIATVSAKKIKWDFKEFNISKIKLDGDTNLGSVSLRGNVLKNELFSKTTLNLYREPYFKKLVKEIDFESLNPISADLNINKNHIQSKIYLSSNNLFDGNLSFLDLNLKTSISTLNYNFASKILDIKTEANLKTAYFDDADVKNRFVYDKHFLNQGDLIINQISDNIPKELHFLLKDAKVNYNIDSNLLKVNLNSSKLYADFDSKDFQKGSLKIRSKPIFMSRFVKDLPPTLKKLKFKLQTDSLIDFQNVQNTKTHLNINSNAIDIKADLNLTKDIHSKMQISLAKGSILSEFDKNIKWQNIFPLRADFLLEDNLILLSFQNDRLYYVGEYNLKSDEINSTLDINNHQIVKINGKLNKTIQIDTNISSLAEFQNRLSQFYKFEKQPIDAEAKVKVQIDKLKSINANIDALWFWYEYEKNRFRVIENIKTDLSFEDDKLKIKNYSLDIFDKHIFANRLSSIDIKQNHVAIEQFWINDKAKIDGEYDLNSSHGEFKLVAKDFYYTGKEGEITFDASLSAVLSKEITQIEGDILIKSGIITYEPKKEHYVTDDDIVIIQEEETKAKEKEQDKLALDIKVLTKKSIKYKVNSIDVDLESDIQLWKEKQKPLELLGIIKLLGGSYEESNKEFLIQNSEILFGGKALNPYLNIKATHKNEPYMITIDILGTLEAPVISFTSNPYLSQSDILSIILFNTATSDLLTTKQNSSTRALSMFGNTFAKELVSNFGIKLDKLVLLTTPSGKLGVEVGKKISKKITIIYINDDVSTVKIKYENSSKFETDLLIKPDSSGINFSYKREY